MVINTKGIQCLVGILVLAALLTPPDIISQLILGVPTYLLFEAGLLAARRYKGRQFEESEKADH